MKHFRSRLCVGLFAAVVLAESSFAQRALTWQEVREKFEMANPTLRAGQIGVDESRADEITANLRPNPQFTFTADGLQLTPHAGHWEPIAGLVKSPGVSQSIERQHKRKLRTDSARQATAIATSQLSDQERTLLFNLRQAFIQTLQQKAVVALANENLSYYDHLLDVNRDRYKAGAIAQVDLDRLELQRVQYESDLQNAIVSLRTAKIQLLTLLNDRTPVEQFDVTGPFDFSPQIMPLDDVRQAALDARPDLKAAMQSVEKAKTDNRLA
jgi:cobalt-zinc-cadmium efflux system outer membrane protein